MLLTGFVVLLYELAVVLPGIEHWHQGDFRKAKDGVPASASPEAYWVGLLLLIGGLTFFLHAVATLVVLNAPAVAEAFRGGSATGD